MLLADVLDHGRRRAGTAPAILAPDRVIDFAALGSRVARLAAGLARRVRPGDRVVLFSENRPEVVECYYGVPAAGAVLVLANHRWGEAELRALVEDTEPRLVVAEPGLLQRLGDARPASDVITFDDGGYEALLAGADPDDRPAPRHADDAAWLIPTSGTTGRAKGVVLTHRNIVAGVVTGALGRPVAPDDVYLFPFPLCHVAGYNVLIQHLHGRPVVLPRRFDPDLLWEDVHRHAVTSMSLAPTMLAMLLDRTGGRSEGPPPTLRTIGYGASAMPVPLLRRAEAELGCGFAQGYGMTELAGNVSFLDPELHRRGLAGEPDLLATCGRPSPLVGLRIVDDAGVDLPPGATGEIVVRGDQVTAGYWRDPESTRAAFLPGGWFRTGDIGRLGGDGLLSIVDRKKDLIITGGENVSSLEVEDVLHAHPAVRAAAVVGVPDPTWGEAVCAVVVPVAGVHADEALADELVALVRANLAPFKKPRRVVFVPELPTTASGKVVKAELRRRLAGR